MPSEGLLFTALRGTPTSKPLLQAAARNRFQPPCRVVGYANVSSNGVKTVSAGAVFTPVNGAKTFLLKEWKPNGVEEGDKFQLLATDNARTIGRYEYISKAYADTVSETVYDEPGLCDYAIGWWQFGKVDWEDTEGISEFRADSTPINVGDSFLVACGDMRDFSAQSAGQVPTEETSIKRLNVKTPFFCNYLPVDLKLKNLTVNGVEEGDKFQILDSINAKTVGRYEYISKAYADLVSETVYDEPGLCDYAIGWWQFGKVDWEDTEGTSKDRADNVIIGPGQGILVAAGDIRATVEFTFPSALEATK